MNVYKVTTPAISACVFAEDANAAIDCFVDEFVQEYFGICESDINRNSSADTSSLSEPNRKQ
jgi:hypothetical protein